MKNKRAQIGETLTWMVATVIIVFMLGISIFIASFYLGKNKNITNTRTADLLASESFYSYLLTNDNGNLIYHELQTPNDFSGNIYGGKFQGNSGLSNSGWQLSQKVFDLSSGEYKSIWLGVAPKNGFSGLKSPLSPSYSNVVYDTISLDENKSVAFYMGK